MFTFQFRLFTVSPTCNEYSCDGCRSLGLSVYCWNKRKKLHNSCTCKFWKFKMF